jgi:LmbE family N-acetylglucosaminyl deacetylase
MNAAQALQTAAAACYRRLSDVVGQGGLVIVAPHPDDESLACGGLIAEACAQGRATRVIVVSDGTGSHPRSKRYPKARLRTLRESEALRAVGALGLAPRHVSFLRLPDRFVPTSGAAAQSAVERIAACARSISAGALFVSWRHDPHCDHQASYQLARAAQRLLAGVTLYEYSVWGSALPPSTPVAALGDGFRLAIARPARKRRAIAAHRSQTTSLINDDPGGFRLSPADLARFAKPYESFFTATE